MTCEKDDRRDSSQSHISPIVCIPHIAISEDMLYRNVVAVYFSLHAATKGRVDALYTAKESAIMYISILSMQLMLCGGWLIFLLVNCQQRELFFTNVGSTNLNEPILLYSWSAVGSRAFDIDSLCLVCAEILCEVLLLRGLRCLGDLELLDVALGIVGLDRGSLVRLELLQVKVLDQVRYDLTLDAASEPLPSLVVPFRAAGRENARVWVLAARMAIDRWHRVSNIGQTCGDDIRWR